MTLTCLRNWEYVLQHSVELVFSKMTALNAHMGDNVGMHLVVSGHAGRVCHGMAMRVLHKGKCCTYAMSPHEVNITEKAV